MGELITIAILVGALLIIGLLLIAFTYPHLLLRAGKFLFVKPVKAIFRVGQ
jgi:hypothetical protein